MAQEPKYKTAKALRRALEDRLLKISEKEQVDLQRLRRQVAFDRLLARLFHNDPSPWALKGGYAMELRIKTARATRDLDLTLRSVSGAPNDKKKRNGFYQDQLQTEADRDLGDFFVFLIGEAMMDLDAAPDGGARFPVKVEMEDRSFIKFHLDLGVGDFPMDPLEKTEGRDWLEFAGIPVGKIWAIPKEQQFAEKLHAYTRPRTQPNSRTRDLIDLVLLIESRSLKSSRVVEALEKTFSKRKSHALPDILEPPPLNWNDRFETMAKECNLSPDIEGAFKQVQDYFSQIKEK
jgi:hypothetical protein